ncbi:MAG TPA: flagellar motor protein MotB [Terriglobales bacterium]|jgi:chemotaxis protein MotB
MRRRRRKPSGANHERWLVSYADFITLLFAFFVVMYSSAQMDKGKVGQLALAIQVAFQQMGVFPPPTADIPINTDDSLPPSAVRLIESDGRITDLGEIVPVSPDGVSRSKMDDQDNLDALRRELMQTLAGQIARNEIALRTGTDGLIISLHEIAFFDSGSAQLRAGSMPTFARIAKILNQRAYRIRIEGHTDDRPIHNPQFASNWELSTARATELVRLLITQYGYSPARLAAAGYAQYHPIASNDVPEGRAQNRRVDIVVLGKVHELAALPLRQMTPRP